MIALERAANIDRDRIFDLLWENGMEFLDPVEDFMVARKNGRIIGCGRMENFENFALLRPLVIDRAFRGQGVGKMLLERIMPDDKTTLVVARGKAVGFYKTLGFTAAGWQLVPDHQKEECSTCGMRPECGPQPMVREICGG